MARPEGGSGAVTVKRYAGAVFAYGLSLLLIGASTFANGMGWILAEEKEISSGSLNGFAIGDSMEEVARNIERLDARDLMSIKGRDTKIDSGNVRQRLSLLKRWNGLRLSNSDGVDIALFLERDVIVDIEGAGKDLSRFRPGQPRSEVIPLLEQLLKSRNDAFIQPVPRVDSAYWGALNRDRRKALEVLRGYEAWIGTVLSEKPDGATYQLFFDDNRLVSIKYQRPRFAK